MKRRVRSSILTLAARYKDRFQRDYLAMGREQIRKGTEEPPFGWIVPGGGPDPGTAAEMVRILSDTGIKVRKAKTPIEASGVTYPAGSWVLPANQPYRAHLKDMMEKQKYPPRFSSSGEAEPPYDVAGWTLPLQMGVKSVVLERPIVGDLEPVETVEAPRGGIDGDVEAAKCFAMANQANDDFRVLNALLKAGVDVRVVFQSFMVGEKPIQEGTVLIPADPKARQVLEGALKECSSRARAEGSDLLAAGNDKIFPLGVARVAVYQPWVPSMDEGWTRLVLEKFGFAYQTVHDADLRAGGLKNRFDVLLIPSMDPKTIREGYGPNESDPLYTGGLGPEGTKAVADFVRAGGTLVCLEDSCPFAIDELKLPVKNVVKGLKTSEFYGPGSIVKLGPLTSRPFNSLTVGLPDENAAYFDRSLAFEFPETARDLAPIRYGAMPVLESGWLLGGEKIAGKPAVADLDVGEGRVILFAFPPQHRGQTYGTFRLLFNALLSHRYGTSR